MVSVVALNSDAATDALLLLLLLHSHLFIVLYMLTGATDRISNLSVSFLFVPCAQTFSDEPSNMTQGCRIVSFSAIGVGRIEFENTIEPVLIYKSDL